MRCHDVKSKLAPSHEPLSIDEVQEMRDHLQQCSDCAQLVEGQRSVDTLLKTSRKMTHPLVAQSFASTGSVSTNSIMHAVQKQRQISQQLEVLHEQQRTRVARMRRGGVAVAALTFFTLSSIPLLLLAITLVQTDLMVHLLLLLSSVVDVFFVLGQYVQMALTLVTRNSVLFAGVSFAVVVMMGMWLRLMRPPREA